jgi:hypothetical protein
MHIACGVVLYAGTNTHNQLLLGTKKSWSDNFLTVRTIEYCEIKNMRKLKRVYWILVNAPGW